MLASCRGVYKASTWCELGLARNVNSTVGEIYLGITCGLIQPRGILVVWKGLLQRIVRTASCVNGLHPGGATLPSGRKQPSVFTIIIIFLCGWVLNLTVVTDILSDLFTHLAQGYFWADLGVKATPWFSGILLGKDFFFLGGGGEITPWLRWVTPMSQPKKKKKIDLMNGGQFFTSDKLLGKEKKIIWRTCTSAKVYNACTILVNQH